MYPTRQHAPQNTHQPYEVNPHRKDCAMRYGITYQTDRFASLAMPWTATPAKKTRPRKTKPRIGRTLNRYAETDRTTAIVSRREESGPRNDPIAKRRRERRKVRKTFWLVRGNIFAVRS